MSALKIPHKWWHLFFVHHNMLKSFHGNLIFIESYTCSKCEIEYKILWFRKKVGEGFRVLQIEKKEICT